jgi:hypothetical protein
LEISIIAGGVKMRDSGGIFNCGKESPPVLCTDLFSGRGDRLNRGRSIRRNRSRSPTGCVSCLYLSRREEETCLVGVVELPFSAASQAPLAERYPSSLTARRTTGLDVFTARGRRIRSGWESPFPLICISAEEDIWRFLPTSFG